MLLNFTGNAQIYSMTKFLHQYPTLAELSARIVICDQVYCFVMFTSVLYFISLNKSDLSQLHSHTVVSFRGSVQESILGRRFLVRAGGDRGLLVSFPSFDVSPYPTDV